VGEGLGESRGFVEGGDDDGDAGHDWVGFYLFAIGHTIQQS
jgi:hypothetical protein